MDRTESSIQVRKLWIKFFDSKLIQDIKVNDNVKVTYQDNQKGEKVYHNGKAVEIITAKLTNVNSTISDSTLNTIIMTIKEIYLTRKDKSLLEVTTDVINSYKQIVENIK